MDFQILVMKYALSAPESFLAATEEEIDSVYNGAGPDWMPEWGCDILTEFLRIFKPAIAIHDWRYEYADGTEEGFKTANEEFLANMRKIIAAEYSRWNPLYWKWQWRAWLAYRACVKLGWSSWLDN
ncbi:MAG: hypothetical protein WCS27_18435 [Victivallaceae bacterium]|jgi:hypothetical protein